MNDSVSKQAVNVGMIIKRGDVIIAIKQVDGFGKNPVLWIGGGNQLMQVASFKSVDKAMQFCKWLEFIVGHSNDNPLLEVVKNDG